MSRIYHDQIPQPQEAVKMGLAMTFNEASAFMAGATGEFIFDMWDAESGVKLAHWRKKNIITRDGGILAARLFRNSLEPNTGLNNGLTMLGIGTGATGNLLAPDAPQNTQRKLNTEITRKAFSSAQFRNSSGVAVAIPTNIVDFTCTYGETEAVGPLNEMGVMSTFSINPATKNQINDGPTSYDATIDVSAKDLLANYLTFSVVTKPSTAILQITWRLTF